jgi:hypothetical protein
MLTVDSEMSNDISKVKNENEPPKVRACPRKGEVIGEENLRTSQL